MFQSPDSDADAPKVPPAQSSNSEPHQERVRHVVYGSLRALDRLTKILHVLNYAEIKEWSDPIPTEEPGRWMIILTKIMLIE
ncbi:MAG TPA: hypothetical protein V6D07_14835 [Trichocoleus sp.]